MTVQTELTQENMPSVVLLGLLNGQMRQGERHLPTSLSSNGGSNLSESQMCVCVCASAFSVLSDLTSAGRAQT